MFPFAKRPLGLLVRLIPQSVVLDAVVQCLCYQYRDKQPCILLIQLQYISVKSKPYSPPRWATHVSGLLYQWTPKGLGPPRAPCLLGAESLQNVATLSPLYAHRIISKYQKYYNKPIYVSIEYAREREIETAHATPSETRRGLSSHLLSIASSWAIISTIFINKAYPSGQKCSSAGIHRQDKGLRQHTSKNSTRGEEEEPCGS